MCKSVSYKYKRSKTLNIYTKTVLKGGGSPQLNTTTVWEKHPRSHPRVLPMQTQPAVMVGFELATNGIQFYVFANPLGQDVPVINWSGFLPAAAISEEPVGV